jgi:MinD superfamily P-loop ATPase
MIRPGASTAGYAAVSVLTGSLFREKKPRAVPASCMECGACALNCPVQAIEVQSGVGCAHAMISAALRGKDMDSGECSCGGPDGSCCGGPGEKSEICEAK